MSTDQMAPGQSPAALVKEGDRRPYTTIRATKGWGNLGLGEVWRYRELLWFLTVRDIRAANRQTALGPLWFVVRPLVNMVIFSLIFGRLANLPTGGIPYPIFTFTALLPWTYFATATSAAVASLVNRMGIISKIYFPRLIVPISGVLAALLDLVLSFVILLGMMVFYRIPPTWLMITLPFFVLFAAATALTVGLWGATLAVKYRDVVVGVGFLLTAWMYLTPVAYSAALIPERWQLLYQMNPMYWVVEGFRWALLGTGKGPDLLMLIPLSAVVVLLISGIFVFRRTERSIVDLL